MLMTTDSRSRTGVRRAAAARVNRGGRHPARAAGLRSGAWRLAACALAAATVLCGCAGAASRDPFVGTWRASGGGLDLVIVRHHDRYSVTMVTSSGSDCVPADRRGDELDAVRPVIPGRRGWALRQVLALHGGTLRLTCARDDLTFRLSRASLSTAIPTLSPSTPT
jgi:hypothetical protein